MDLKALSLLFCVFTDRPRQAMYARSLCLLFSNDEPVVQIGKNVHPTGGKRHIYTLCVIICNSFECESQKMPVMRGYINVKVCIF